MTAAADRTTAVAGAPAAGTGIAGDTTGVRADTTGVAGDTTAAGDRGGSPRPAPSVDGRSNWVRGDTLIAIFERDSLAVRDSAQARPGVGDRGAGPPAPADSSGIVPPLPPTDSLSPAVAPDTASDPLMKRLIAIGHASSFYAQVRDSSQTNRPSRNYMIGKRIDVFFSDGEPQTVKGVEAIGIYLEPEEGLEGGAAAGVSDSTAARADSTRLLPDSLAVPADPRVARDSIPPDSARLGRGSMVPSGGSAGGTGPPVAERTPTALAATRRTLPPATPVDPLAGPASHWIRRRGP